MNQGPAEDSRAAVNAAKIFGSWETIDPKPVRRQSA